jgi:hypothetical protein
MHQRFRSENVSSAAKWRGVLRGIHVGDRGWLTPQELTECLVEVTDFEFNVVDPWGPETPNTVLTRAVKMNVRRLAALGFIPMPDDTLLECWPESLQIEVPPDFSLWLRSSDAPQPSASLHESEIVSQPCAPSVPA